MTVVTYNTLVADKSTDGSIKAWVDHDSIPAPLIVAEAEQYLWRRLRVRQQVSNTSGTISQGTDTLSLPSDYIATRLLSITDPDPAELEMRWPEEVERRRFYDGNGNLEEGRPLWFYADAASFVFTTQTDKAYNYRLLYFKQPAALSASNPTNFLTDRAFRAFLGALLSFAWEWLQDIERANRWIAVADNEILALNAEADFESGLNLHMAAYAE